MEEKSIAKQCGNRLRRVRMARNMSQQELADKMFTTPQNISKYEKEGIANIDIIQKLSAVLGHDLLSDEMDEEGTVGEIGKEILSVLIQHKGYFDVEDLMSGYMYGMKMERVTKEVFKLEKIGMCVREQYVDFLDRNRDGLFITAKGIITYKNMLSGVQKDEMWEQINSVVTYEEQLEEAESYQEYIDNRPEEKMIRQLEHAGNYRSYYLQYLHETYEEGLEAGKKRMPQEFIYPGVSCYFDILYRMSLGLSNEKVKDISMDDEEWEWLQLSEEIEYGEDKVKAYARHQFERVFPWIVQDLHRQGLNDVDEDNPKLDRLIELDVKALESDRFYDGRGLYEEMYKEKVSAYPTEWFSKEEIEQFINENMMPASTEKEHKLDEQLAEINRLIPETLSYYEFPQEWEENGLADMIRGRYNLPK